MLFLSISNDLIPQNRKQIETWTLKSVKLLIVSYMIFAIYESDYTHKNNICQWKYQCSVTTGNIYFVMLTFFVSAEKYPALVGIKRILTEKY